MTIDRSQLDIDWHRRIVDRSSTNLSLSTRVPAIVPADRAIRLMGASHPHQRALDQRRRIDDPSYCGRRSSSADRASALTDRRSDSEVSLIVFVATFICTRASMTCR